MASPFKFEDFQVGDEVYYIPKHLQPKDGSSPLFKHCREGIISDIKFPYIIVKYINKAISRVAKGVYYNSKGELTRAEDLWK